MWSSLAYGGEAKRQNVSERQPPGCGGGGSHLFILSIKLFTGITSPSVMLNHRVGEMRPRLSWLCSSGLGGRSITTTETSLSLQMAPVTSPSPMGPLDSPSFDSLTHSWLKSPSLRSSCLVTNTQLSRSTATPCCSLSSSHRWVSITRTSTLHSSGHGTPGNPESSTLLLSSRHGPAQRPST